MGILRRIESSIEGAFEGTFGRAFRANVEPVELARKLAKELEDGKVVSVTQTYAPNEYTVYLSARDRERFAEYEASLRTELSVYLADHARREGYVLTTRPKVAFETEARLSVGTFGIATRLSSLDEPDEAPVEPLAAPSPAVEQPSLLAEPLAAPEPAVVAPEPEPEPAIEPPAAALEPPLPSLVTQPVLPVVPIPVPPDLEPEPVVDAAPPEPEPVAEVAAEPEPLVEIEPEPEEAGSTMLFSPAEAAAAGLGSDASVLIDGRRVPLAREVTTLGRSSACDIVLDDANASRRHAELRVRGRSAVLVDLESTNGTAVNGRRIREQPLSDGDRITIGTTALTFQRSD